MAGTVLNTLVPNNFISAYAWKMHVTCILRAVSMIRQCDSWPLLETADAVIDGVGGTFAAAKISGRPAQQVSNWRRTGTLAPGTFLNFQRALAERQLRARPSLWRIDEPANGAE
ncbi:hypothetical protein ABIF68_007341 [Bradyrhizobium japonicum]